MGIPYPHPPPPPSLSKELFTWKEDRITSEILEHLGLYARRFGRGRLGLPFQNDFSVETGGF